MICNKLMSKQSLLFFCTLTVVLCAHITTALGSALLTWQPPTRRGNVPSRGPAQHQVTHDDQRTQAVTTSQVSGIMPKSIYHPSDVPVLCTHCSKLPEVKGVPVRMGKYSPYCKHCGITSCCTVKDDKPSCTRDPKHQCTMTLMCCTCDAIEEKGQVIHTTEAIPYQEGGFCEISSAGCTEHLFRASVCGHTFCNYHLRLAITSLLAPAHYRTTDEKQEQYKKLADSFTTDEEDFLVPPCPLCFKLGVEKDQDNKIGHFSLQTCRLLHPRVFLTLKSTANTAFYRRKGIYQELEEAA